MTSESPPRCGALIFAIDEPTRAAGEELIEFTDDWAQLVVCNTGDALRLIHRHDPRILFVCAGLLRLEESAAMVQVLHHRRPQLPLLAIAARHDPTIERAVRSAGAGYYFALDTESERLLLMRTLESLGFPTTAASDTPTARSRGAPPIRAV